jgi:hypothetical protein
MNIYSSHVEGSGSTDHGGLLFIYHRWHDCNRIGHWLCTIHGMGIGHNYHAVVDDFGDMRVVG